MKEFINKVKIYYQLTKPGIIYGNALPAIAGFFLAAKNHFNIGLFLAMLVGLSFIIASACVTNNYIDRNIDKKMERTKKRALVVGAIPLQHAIIYAVVLGIFGSLILGIFTNILTLSIALMGFFFYVVMYGIWKRRSVYGTIVGSISGAVPPVVGYCAVTNQIDSIAIVLFMILVLWQMPHFYAIAMYRMQDYGQAAIPVLPLKKGLFVTKITTVFYIIAFIIAASMLTILKATGYVYAGVMVFSSLIWLGFGIQGFRTSNTQRWARTLFIFSLVIILVFCLFASIDVVSPTA